jgi:hypothetical protein
LFYIDSVPNTHEVGQYDEDYPGHKILTQPDGSLVRQGGKKEVYFMMPGFVFPGN